MPVKQLHAPLWLSSIITILLVGAHTSGWWFSALTTLTLLVAVLVMTFTEKTPKENDNAR